MSLFQQIYVGVLTIILIILMILNFNSLWVMLLFNILSYFILGNIEQFTKGFSNSGILLVLLISPILVPIVESHQVNKFLHKIFSYGSNHIIANLAKFTIPSFMISCFMPNTPIVIALVPFISKWCKSNDLSVSKYLIPLSYSTILGGVNTLIGTSTNLLSSSIVSNWGIYWNMFEMTPITIIPSIISLLLIILISNWLLPNNLPYIDQEPKESLYKCQITIPGNSELIGLSLKKAICGHTFHSEVICDNNVDDNYILKENDNILVHSTPGEIINFLEEFNDSIRTRSLEHFSVNGLKNRLTYITGKNITYPSEIKSQFYKVVLSKNSQVVGKSIESNIFECTYNALIIGLSNITTKMIHSRDIENSVSNAVELSIIDDETSLLVYGTCHFLANNANNSDFISITRYRGARLLSNNYDQYIVKYIRQWHLALFLFISSIIISSTNVINILPLIIISIFIIASLKILTLNSIIEYCNWSVYLLLVLSSNIGLAIVQSGLDIRMADLIGFIHNAPQFIIISIIGLITVALTSFTSNAACVSILLPVVHRICSNLHLPASPMLLYITALASIDFLTPYGYQTNLIVQPMGRYKCLDYVKLGSIVTTVYYITLTISLSLYISNYAYIYTPIPTHTLSITYDSY